MEINLEKQKTPESTTNKVKDFGLRDKIGYMFGDIGNDFSFIFASSFLMIFYTKVLGISGAAVGTLFLVSRFIDAITDVTMGRIVDRTSSRKNGKFKPWILWMSGPVTIASFLMYQSSLAGASMTTKIIYMYVTYLIWGSIFYTSINIPYGSMASAVTDNPEQKTALSVFRNMGAMLASVFIGVFTPLVIYTRDAAGNQIVRGGNTFTIIAGVFSILAFISYMICYKLTTERVKFEKTEAKEQVTFIQSLKSILKNQSLLAIIGAAIFLLLAQLLISTMNNYIFADFYNNASGIVLMNLAIPFMIILLISPLALKLSAKYGKKEVVSVAMLFSGVIYGLIYLLRPENMTLFILLSIIGYAGLGLFNTVIWANITDVIDDQEVKSGKREDGTIYAVYSFARKIGQALAGGIGGWALTYASYNSLAATQTKDVLNKLFTISTLVPAICFFICGLILTFMYPLTKAAVLKNTKILKNKKK